MTQNQRPTHRFLYIEDHAASRRVLHVLLTELLGYEDVTLLETGANLLATIAGQAFDVIFLDINLRPQNGYDICALLRQQPDYAETPIIALTAHARPDDMRRMQATGFTGLLRKPLNHQTFPQSLERILAGEPLWDE